MPAEPAPLLGGPTKCPALDWIGLCSIISYRDIAVFIVWHFRTQPIKTVQMKMGHAMWPPDLGLEQRTSSAYASRCSTAALKSNNAFRQLHEWACCHPGHGPRAFGAYEANVAKAEPSIARKNWVGWGGRAPHPLWRCRIASSQTLTRSEAIRISRNDSSFAPQYCAAACMVLN